MLMTYFVMTSLPHKSLPSKREFEFYFLSRGNVTKKFHQAQSRGSPQHQPFFDGHLQHKQDRPWMQNVPPFSANSGGDQNNHRQLFDLIRSEERRVGKECRS